MYKIYQYLGIFYQLKEKPHKQKTGSCAAVIQRFMASRIRSRVLYGTFTTPDCGSLEQVAPLNHTLPGLPHVVYELRRAISFAFVLQAGKWISLDKLWCLEISSNQSTAGCRDAVCNRCDPPASSLRLTFTTSRHVTLGSHNDLIYAAQTIIN